jgi:hypothetical protein
MPSELSQVILSSACNDNGAATLLGSRRTAPRDVLTAAARACETVLLDYVARGSLLVTRADRRRCAVAA